MRAYSIIQLYTWFDAAYGVHTDIKATLVSVCHLDMGCYIGIPASIN